MRRHVVSPVFFAAVLGASLLAACGADPGAAAPAATIITAPATSLAAAPTDAPSSLQFSGDLVAGGTVDFRSYAGTTLALWFWAPT